MLFADTLMRYGVGADNEVRINIAPYVHDRKRTPGGVMIAGGFGDVALSQKHRFVDGISIAALSFVVLPVDGTRSIRG